MIKTVDSRAFASAFLLVALLLRASIPSGYMPAAPGTGLLFELCPEGLPAGLFASQGGHHHHHDGHGSDDTSSTGESDTCPIGHMLSSAAAVDEHADVARSEEPEVHGLVRSVTTRDRVPVPQRSRDPPA
jgi:hypothetical protein